MFGWSANNRSIQKRAFNDDDLKLTIKSSGLRYAFHSHQTELIRAFSSTENTFELWNSV